MKTPANLLRAFVESHPNDAAHAFETLDLNDRSRLFKLLPIQTALSLLERVNPDISASSISTLDDGQVRKLLSKLPPRTASSIFHQLDEQKRESVLSEIDENVARSLRELANYDEETAGGMMDPRVVALRIDQTIQQAISAIRKAPRDSLHYLYVTQRDGRLIGVVTMRDLLLAAPRDPLASVVRENVVSVPDTMSSEEVFEIMQDRRYLAMPVVDFDNHLIGVVKQSDALEAMQESAYEDLQTIVGAGAQERALSPVSLVVRSRLPWLCINLVTAFLAAAVIGAFEGIIAQVAALAVLLPVVAGQGGNTGAQSLAVVMRGLALRELVSGTEKRVVIKELLGGLVNGTFVAFISMIAVLTWRLLAGDTIEAGVGLSCVIGIAMVINMGTAALSGAAIPLILKSVGRDPAQSASIFLTTVTDIVGFAAFLGLAYLFMPLISG